jgi:nitrate reductase NapE component
MGRDGDGGDEGDGNEPPGGLRNRVVHLEHRMGGVEGKLDVVITQLGGIATRTEMRNYLLLALGLFVAIATLLIGGLGWLETRATRVQPATTPQTAAPQPIIIQVPYPASTPTPPPGK